MGYMPGCNRKNCDNRHNACNRCESKMRQMEREARDDSGFSEPMGGCDADGNSLTASFGYGNRDGETLLGDGDRSEVNFRDHENHDHYGSGSGRNNNVKDRGQYKGRGN